MPVSHLFIYVFAPLAVNLVLGGQFSIASLKRFQYTVNVPLLQGLGRRWKQFAESLDMSRDDTTYLEKLPLEDCGEEVISLWQRTEPTCTWRSLLEIMISLNGGKPDISAHPQLTVKIKSHPKPVPKAEVYSQHAFSGEAYPQPVVETEAQNQLAIKSESRLQPGIEAEVQPAIKMEWLVEASMLLTGGKKLEEGRRKWEEGEEEHEEEKEEEEQEKRMSDILFQVVERSMESYSMLKADLHKCQLQKKEAEDHCHGWLMIYRRMPSQHPPQ